MIKVSCFGEVLWDVFPTHKKIGGAPLNVAVRMKSMGNETSVISRIGDDEDGKKIVNFLKDNQVDTSGIQVDSQYKTSTVEVTLDQNGAASYEIVHPRAWDKIECTPTAIALAKSADAFIFGSLSSRDAITRTTLYELLKWANYKIFDVNLRPPYYNAEVLHHLMNEADLIKFNDEEIFEIARLMHSNAQTLEETIVFIAEKTHTDCICVTKGGAGAVLFFEGKFYYNSGYKVTVVDTVGAGDSFLATLISKIMKQTAPQEALNYACAMGALVASNEGANPIINEEELTQLMGMS
ncbi:carbohydrate kinase [Flavobacterium sp. UMI-01]|uniref:carbohydrate kinase family protein n=1 Tax=Flavobacterium sp. UMI-01 TaxID=1441053 RepID=UPI001C7D7DD9|nr:carbohydrate kinase [Flavobacterium sp. UMI-01]GIZ09325.1 fructokinase [Flavobacterium sp. UMI-01]